MEKRWTLRMPEMNRPSKSAQNLDRLRSEGDLNLSPHRRAWAVENISRATQRTLDEDAGYFLHQSLSTPCLNALKSCQSAWIQDVEGRRYLDFHGNNVHQVGFGHPLPGCEHVPPPDNRHCPFRCGNACNLACADYLEYVLEKEGDVAAVIGETVRSTPFIPPLDYWKRIRAACDKHGALLILDEIPTGLGRTGRIFACEHYDIVPDMLV